MSTIGRLTGTHCLSALVAALSALIAPAASAQIRPVATLESGFSEDAFAFAEKVASIGDHDGDGTPDIVGFFMGGTAGRRTGIVYSGSTFEMLDMFSHGGRTVDVGYDVTGDGVREIAVGTERGAYVIDGKAGALRTPLMWPRHSGHGTYGSSVVSIRNAVRDETDDYVVAASGGDFYGQPTGILYVFDGANGDTSLYAPSRPPYPAYTGTTNGFRNLFSLGDFDRDGYGDFAVGAPTHRPTDDKFDPFGRVYIYSGATGQFDYQLVNPDTAWNGANIHNGFGSSLLVVADMNGDEFSELVVASPAGCTFAPFARSCLYRYDGRTGALLDTLVHSQNETTGAEFGASLAEISDIDGDGIPELVVGAPSADNRRCCSWPRDAGLVYIYSGRTLRLLHTLESPSKPTNIYAHFGRSVANAGDLDGDGFDEILVSAPNEITATRPSDGAPSASGRIYVFNLARSTAVRDEKAPPHVTLSVSPNPVHSAASVSLSLPQGGAVHVTVYDALGREVQRVLEEALPAGLHTEYVDFSRLAAGRYAIRLTTSAGIVTRMVTVVR